jgi:hypothetical protein
LDVFFSFIAFSSFTDSYLPNNFYATENFSAVKKRDYNLLITRSRFDEIADRLTYIPTWRLL